MKTLLVIIVVLLGLNLSGQQIYQDSLVEQNIFKEIASHKQATNPQIIILDFWATWCKPCIKSIPNLLKYQRDFQNTIEIIFVNSFDTNERSNSFLDKNNLSFNNYADTLQRLSTFFGVHAIPQTFIINNNGSLLWRGTPELLTKEIINDLLNNKSLEEKTNQMLLNITCEKSYFTDKRGTSLTTYENHVEYEFYNMKRINILSAIADNNDRVIVPITDEDNSIYTIKISANNKARLFKSLDNLLFSLSTCLDYSVLVENDSYSINFN
jgi:thiol-disulfide isomerase/thioredoxin